MKLAASPSLKNSLLINCVYDLRAASSEPRTASLLKKPAFQLFVRPSLPLEAWSLLLLPT
jgi:hypothetical protein